MPDKYAPAERAAVIFLALADQEVPNADFKKLYGFELPKAGRERLNKDGLIKTRTEKRRLFHKITDDGVDWYEGELGNVEAPLGAGPLARAVFEVFRLILRHGDVDLADVPRWAALESQIRVAYGELQTKQQDYVRLADLRARLDGADKDDVDRALLAMTRTRRVHLSPDSDRRAVTDADRAAAIRIGSEDLHTVLIEES